MKINSPFHFARLMTFAALTWMASVSARADYQSTVQSYGPVGYWQFNETAASPSLNAVTNFGSTGSAANGYLVYNATNGQPGRIGQSIRFTNPGNIINVCASKVDVAYNPLLNTAPPFTIEFWAKPNSLGTDTAGFVPVSNFDPNLANGGNRSGWAFFVNNTGNWTFRLGSTNGYKLIITNTTANASVGSWQHLVATYDGTNATLYANGALVASGALAASNYVPNSESVLRIGGTPLDGAGEFYPPVSASCNNGNRGFDGWVDELALYTNVLTPSVIAAHFSAATTNTAGYQSQILSASPVGYWPMNEPFAGTPSPASLVTVTNSGSLGTSANGTAQWGTLTGQAGSGFSGLGGANKAAFFDGANGYVQLNDAAGLHFTNNITLMAWVKPLAKDFYREIIAHGMNTNRTETFLRISRGSGGAGYGTGNFYELGSGGGTTNGSFIPYLSVYFPIPDGDIGQWVFLAGTFGRFTLEPLSQRQAGEPDQRRSGRECRGFGCYQPLVHRFLERSLTRPGTAV